MIDFQPDQARDEQREAAELCRDQQVHHVDLQTAAQRERQVDLFTFCLSSPLIVLIILDMTRPSLLTAPSQSSGQWDQSTAR